VGPSYALISTGFELMTEGGIGDKLSPTLSLGAIPTMMTGRRFLLSDAIVFVAATAVGLAVVRPYHATMILLDWSPPSLPRHHLTV
jgi:hypothetical protein